MSDIASFLSPLPQNSSIQPGVNGRVQLPSLMNIFPFEGAPQFSIPTNLAPSPQKEEESNSFALNDKNRTSNEIRVTSFINYNELDSEVPNQLTSNQINKI